MTRSRAGFSACPTRVATSVLGRRVEPSSSTVLSGGRGGRCVAGGEGDEEKMGQELIAPISTAFLTILASPSLDELPE